MEITLHLMKLADKPLLVRLMELFLYEFSAYSGDDVSEHGYYGYGHIDDYWNEEGRFPYLIRADGRIAGLALVCPHCVYRKEAGAQAVGEFFVMRKYQRQGVGTQAAVQLFDRHPGLWEVCCWNSNLPAQRFWKQVVEQYTDGRYEIRGTEQERETGFIFQNITP